MLLTVFNKFMGKIRSSALINLVLTPLLTSLLLLLSPVWALVVTILLTLGFTCHFSRQDEAATTTAANLAPSQRGFLLYPWYSLRRANVIEGSSSLLFIVVTLTVGSIQLSSMKANTRELSEIACRTTTQIIRDNLRTVGVTAQWSMAHHLTQS
ncbi:Uncharacterised protein [Serratia fonticola]|nr:Uncharacterised protein [Serratia fonticola]